MKKKVEKYFRGADKYNCAQAVAKICSLEAEVENLTADLGSCGGGRAPEGKCGALHALHLLTKEEAAQELKDKFVQASGSDKCKEIRAMKKASCADCVESCATLFVDHPHHKK